MRFLEFSISGLVLGSLYAALAIGFVTLYKSTKVPNFAQGAFGVVAAYMTWWLTSAHQLPFVAAALIGILSAGLLGYCADRFAMRHLIGAPVIALLIFTFGMDTAVTSGVQQIWGPYLQTLKLPFQGQFFPVAGLSVEYTAPMIFAIGLAVVMALAAFFQYTRLGLATRATATNRIWPQFIGINVPAVMSFSWTLAGLLGGLAGIFLSGEFYLSPSLMDTLLLPALTAAALGGFGSIWGAYVGGLAIGVTQDLSAGYIGSSWTAYAPFIVLFVLLMLRPHGLFGVGAERRV